LDQVVQHIGARAEECFFWGTHAGAELDLLVVRGQRKLGFEFKRPSAPELTPSMKIAIEDLGLSSVMVIHAGPESYAMGPRIRAVAMKNLLSELKPLP
jgi:hypothetical protein